MQGKSKAKSTVKNTKTAIKTSKEVAKKAAQGIKLVDEIQSIQDSNAHDEYVLDGSMASCKDILLVYTIKQSNGKNETDVATMNDNKKSIKRNILGYEYFIFGS